jgi:hypothetical protein
MMEHEQEVLMAEALAGVRRLVEQRRQLVEMLRHLCGALDLSDPDHAAFRDSGADVVAHLWTRGQDARALLARIEGRVGLRVKPDRRNGTKVPQIVVTRQPCPECQQRRGHSAVCSQGRD